MNITLPPKRFDNPNDTKYDSIRHCKWFWRLIERREKIPSLKQARLEYLNSGKSQGDVADEFGIDSREFRDYMRFVENLPVINESDPRTAQAILDQAYESYCRDKGKEHISRYIQDAAKQFGVNPRHIIELWDVDSTFYPKGYELRNNK